MKAIKEKIFVAREVKLALKSEESYRLDFRHIFWTSSDSKVGCFSRSLLVAYGRTRGKSLIFFRTPPLKSRKNHIQKSQNHKKITYRKHQKSQITENLLKSHKKKSLESTKIAKKITEKSHVISKSQKSRTLF